MADKRQDQDDFWDLDKLIPKKHVIGRHSENDIRQRLDDKPSPRMRPFASQVLLHEYKDTTPEDTHASSENTRLTQFSGSGVSNAQTYVPLRQTLITRVTIRRYEGQYDFYDRFRRSALLYYDVPGEPAPFVPFFSYMPQYEQMSKAQKDYYFFWRSEVRCGRFPKSDYAYMYLYVYEILNLPEKKTAQEGLSILIDLWVTYRHAMRSLDKVFSVWIQDYCLLYRLTPPMEKLAPFLADLIEVTSFKEFYLLDAEKMTNESIGSLIGYFSDYDYHTCRYCTGDSKAVFETHMHGALVPVLAHMLHAAEWLHTPASLIVRDAFPNSLCTHKVKCRLEIEYHPIARAIQLREGVTAAVKYTENRLRALLGVKSRLSVKGLKDEYKAVIDTYFNAVFEDVRAAQKPPAPAYEHKYDAPKEALSMTGAMDIEKRSWNNTFRLVSESEAKELKETEKTSDITRQNCVSEEKEPVNVLEICQDTATPVSADIHFGLTDAHMDLLRRALLGEVEADASTDVLAETINETFSEQFGDIVLCASDGGYALIEDYREDIAAWLLKLPE